MTRFQSADKFLLRVCFSVLLLLLEYGGASAQSKEEEWNGPMASWANVKTRFHGRGNGVDDDSKALQAALDSLSDLLTKYNTDKNTAFTTIYLPAGTYKISQTLYLKGKIGVNIVGEDPERTIIQWSGADSGTMLFSNGSASVRLSRLTWDGNKAPHIEAIGIHWKSRWKNPGSQSYASVDHEISDCVFRNVWVGVGGGFNWNDSEVTITRCSFYGMSGAAISIKGSNTLDYWIWYCRFYSCKIGINNFHGNYHVFNSYFSRSSVADVVNYNGYYTSLQGCFSENAKAVSVDVGSSNNVFKRVFQNNIIRDVVDVPVNYSHVGKPTFLDNQFDRNLSDTTGKKMDFKKTPMTDQMLPAVINYGSWFSTTLSILSVGNRYYYSNPFRQSTKMPHKNYISDDLYGKTPATSGKDFEKTLPGTPPFVKRTVFEVPAGASGDAIQAIINEASQSPGKRPIVHFPYGQYIINKTLTIPPNSDIQIVGDGMIYSSTLQPQNPNSFQGGCLIAVKGPSFITMRDIQLGANGVPNKNLVGIRFDNIDQQQSFVQLDQLYSLCDTSLFINKLDYTHFEKNNSFFSDGNIVVGGDLQKQGKGTMELYCFGGQFAKSNVFNNGKIVAKDCWWEGDNKVPLVLDGDGDITIDGAMVAPNKGDSSTTISIGRFNGRISLMNMYIQGAIAIRPDNEQLKLFCWDDNFYFKKDVLSMIPPNYKGKLGFAGLTAQCFNKNDPSCNNLFTFNDKFVNVANENVFVKEMVQQDRGAIPKILKPVDGVTSVCISRISLNAFRVGMQFSK